MTTSNKTGYRWWHGKRDTEDVTTRTAWVVCPECLALYVKDWVSSGGMA
jgi:hypothetical protein